MNPENVNAILSLAYMSCFCMISFALMWVGWKDMKEKQKIRNEINKLWDDLSVLLKEYGKKYVENEVTEESQNKWNEIQKLMLKILEKEKMTGYV